MIAASASSALAAPIAAQANPNAKVLLATEGPNMLGTLALPIKATRFSAYLARARQDASASPMLQRLIAPARRLPPVQQLAFVQRSVSNSIRWVSDTTEWGQHEYWASASQTLARGAGDVADRAIVKLQALRALGFRSSDLFLTLARDKVGGPITVLTARLGGRYYVLDDTGGAPFPVEERRNEFQPAMSFGIYGAWIHVRPSIVASATPSSTLAARK
ncbi:MAG TPA: transglutaminase-like cysteine peptidase [Sphingomicrobium sp.]|nr:transglutaminase-like cysteine peptidase [Sphingomicrobium sp.]